MLQFECKPRKFSEARFQFQRLTNGQPGDLFGNPALTPIERPWPGGTTADLLAASGIFGKA
jgi:hypothetical protein